MRTRTAAIALVAGLSLAAPATAGAVTATVSNDDGADVTLGSPLTLATMAPKTVKLTFAASGEVRYSIRVTASDGTVAAEQPCQATSLYAPLPLKFHGSGKYTIAYSVSPSGGDLDCANATQSSGQFTWDPRTKVTNNEKLVLTRRPGNPSSLVHTLAVTPNAGSDRTEVRFARGVSPAADGSLLNPLGGTFSSSLHTFRAAFDKPGRWVFVTRPVSAEGFAGTWSAPLYINVQAPFDLVSAPLFVDKKGPTYKLKGDIRAAVPKKSKIDIFAADGRKGGKFAKITTVRTKKHGIFKVKFTRKQAGRFRIRYRYAGNRLIAPGRVTQLIHIRKVFA
jgi:hypothetical protein